MGHKLKYRDVVKTAPKNFDKRNKKFNKNLHKKNIGKTKQSIYKKSIDFKRKVNFNDDTTTKTKKIREADNELVPEEKVVQDSSESEDEDPLTLLRKSFNISDEPVITESSSSESEEESETNTDDKRNNELNDFKEDSEKNFSSETENESNEEVEHIDNKLAKEIDTELDTETQQEEENLENSNDPFVKHVCYELHPSLLESLESTPESVEMYKETWTRLGDITFQVPKCNIMEISSQTKLDKTIYATPGKIPSKIDSKSTTEDLFIKTQISQNIYHANKSLVKKDMLFTPLQQELFSIINNYQDFYFSERTFDNAEEIRFVYCLHAINHVMKSRIKILHHNAKLLKKEDVPEEFRDQGLVRPKVLIVAPFKDSGYKVINTIIEIMFKEDKGNVSKKNRFVEEYTGNQLYMPKKNPKPDDYEKTFCGNTSEDFTIGISVTKKSLKLYSDFYSSDIIVASPLGLRTIIGAEGEPDRDFDFLTSIELLILDQTEIFCMQNWFHLTHLFDHMHLKPKNLHGTDVFRVRQWCLNLWAKYYRQTLIFSSITLPEINSIFNKKCSNFAGKVKVNNPVEKGCISQVFVRLPHYFHKFDASNSLDAVEARFKCFVDKVLPQQRDSMKKQTLVYIPSYFDYVRIRNYFMKEDIGFVQICEYSKKEKVARARDIFYHGDADFLLYTGRYHFYHRIRVKGIRHLVFYQPPKFPHFYYEMCNLMQESNMNKNVGGNRNMTVTVLYSKYDLLQLSPIVGTEKAAIMFKSDRNVHLMATEGIF